MIADAGIIFRARVRHRAAYGWQRNGGMAPYILCDEKDLIVASGRAFL